MSTLFHHPKNNLWGIVMIQYSPDVFGWEVKNEYRLCDMLHCALIVSRPPRRWLYTSPPGRCVYVFNKSRCFVFFFFFVRTSSFFVLSADLKIPVEDSEAGEVTGVHISF